MILGRIVEGLVPAMPPHQFLESERAKKPIRATTKFKDFITYIKCSGKKHQNLNSRPYKTILTRVDQFKNSFPRTIIDWNQLHDDAVQATSTEAFKRRIPLYSKI